MIKDKLKGLWISSEVILDNNISDKEKLIYALILFFSFQTGFCYITNREISTIFSISATQISKLLHALKKKGYLKIMIKRNDKKQIISRTITPIKLFDNTYLTKVQDPIKLSNKDPIEENFKENNKIYLKNKDKKESSNRMTLSPEYESLDWDSFYCT